VLLDLTDRHDLQDTNIVRDSRKELENCREEQRRLQHELDDLVGKERLWIDELLDVGENEESDIAPKLLRPLERYFDTLTLDAPRLFNPFDEIIEDEEVAKAENIVKDEIVKLESSTGATVIGPRGDLDRTL